MSNSPRFKSSSWQEHRQPAKKSMQIYKYCFTIASFFIKIENKQQIQKQQRRFKRVKKEFLKYFPKEKAEAIEIEQEEVIEIEKFEQTKTPLKRKLNFREQQMNIPVFNADYEKYEWLMKYGCTNPEQRKWLEGYLNSDEYANLYADCEHNEKNVFDQEGV